MGRNRQRGCILYVFYIQKKSFNPSATIFFHWVSEKRRLKDLKFKSFSSGAAILDLQSAELVLQSADLDFQFQALDCQSAGLQSVFSNLHCHIGSQPFVPPWFERVRSAAEPCWRIWKLNPSATFTLIFKDLRRKAEGLNDFSKDWKTYI